MRYEHYDFKFKCDDFFVKCTARYCYMEQDGQPVFKDHRGNFAVLRKKNWTKFNWDSAKKFMRDYFEFDEEFEQWKSLNREFLKDI